LTIDEYHRLAEVGVLARDARVELIDGEIIDMAPIGSRHAATTAFLAKQLIRAVDDAALIFVQSPVRLGTDSAPQPDLAVLRPRPDRYASAHPTAADILLLIEVSDATLRFDRNVKAKLYARHGVAELGIVDVVGEQLEVFRDPRDGDYAQRATRAAGLVAIPGLAIDVELAALF
jgi:Uma2 family endonuclease